MADSDKTVGIIGMGDMGKMYAKRISEAGWRVNACDAPSKYEELKELDYIIYSVPAEAIDSVVAKYGPSTKLGGIVGGQTSCKAPEIAAFEKHLPPDVEIVPVHSLHGPGVDPKGQPLVLIQHRASDASFALVERILSCLNSKHVYLTAAEHDRITADTQAVTHAAFLSMGAAWHANAQFPWEIPRYVGGIENVKINVTLRIYSNKWHVYAGLAILNPYAQRQIRQYAASVTELFKLMLAGHKDELRARIYTAAKAVFRDQGDENLLLKDDVLDRFSLGEKPPERLFRLWLGITEYLFRKPDLLEEVIETAIHDNTFRADDLEFTFAARDWSDRVSLGHMEAYREKFEHIQTYFEPRFPEAKRVGNEMIKTILAKTTNS
ncbi:putative prephenate dehydrogenase protein [Neofusicoccum parvum UCRNP2]|uniref:Putative prephenate dehydrogenase protein n=1 Tax=Botryosphaeria parva (strain UCR-NP2) TaxID=1287680 RepID=R1GUX5_BOTPV|nr:putative prephenate dehydrogenase protein [Neofusicoccum parvum UCRNP2]